MTQISFIAATPEMVSTLKAVGVNTGPGDELPAMCPYAVGDFISFASAPQLAFRVSWRLCAKQGAEPEWVLGVEKTDHPLAGRASSAPR